MAQVPLLHIKGRAYRTYYMQELDVILDKKDVLSLFDNNLELRKLESDFHTTINCKGIGDGKIKFSKTF
jgi:hypothetical protein